MSNENLSRRLARRDFLKLTGVGLASAGLSGFLGACAQAVSPVVQPAAVVTGPINLDFVCWAYSTETILANIKKFEALESDKIKVQMTDFGWPQYHETIVNRFTAKTPTDVMYAGGDWLPEWAKAGWLVPLEDHFPKVKDYYASKIVGYALKDMTYNGKIYGLPYYADITTFMYNAKLLADMGISKPPETWEELADQMKFLQGKGMDAPMALEFAQAMPTTMESFTAMVFGRGGELLDANQDPILDKADGAAFAQLKWLADAYKAKQISLLPHETDVVKALNTGKHAFTVLYNYNLAELNNKATSPLAGQFKIALMPGATHETYGFAKFYTMTKMAADRGKDVIDAAWKFLEYFGGERDGQYTIAKGWAVEKGLGFGQLPLYDDPDVQKSFGQWIDPAMLKEQATKARARVQGTWYGIWGEFVRIELVRAVTGETTVDQALKAAADKAKELKEQYA